MEKQATFFWNARRSVAIVALLRRWVVCNRANSRLSFFLLLLLRSFCYIVIVIPFAESAHMYFLFYHLLSYSLFGAGFLIFPLTEREADEGSFHPFKKKLNTVFFRDVVFFFFPKKKTLQTLRTYKEKHAEYVIEVFFCIYAMGFVQCDASRVVANGYTMTGRMEWRGGGCIWTHKERELWREFMIDTSSLKRERWVWSRLRAASCRFVSKYSGMSFT